MEVVLEDTPRTELGRPGWLDNLQHLRDNGKYCDVIFHVGNNELPAHRNILAAQSAYFSSIFMASNVTREHVNVPCQNPDTVKELLNYFYAGKFRITEAIVFELLKLSSTYLLADLKMHCGKYLERILSLNNCLLSYEHAERYSLTDIKTKVEEFIQKNVSVIAVCQELLRYSFEQLASFLWNKKWKVDDTTKFISICHWVNTKPGANMRYFSELLHNVWFTEVPVNTVRDIFEECSIFKDDLVKKKVFDVMNVQQVLPMQFMELFQKLEKDQKGKDLARTVEDDKLRVNNDILGGSSEGQADPLAGKGADDDVTEFTELAVVKVTNIDPIVIQPVNAGARSDDSNEVAINLVFKKNGDSVETKKKKVPTATLR